MRVVKEQVVEKLARKGLGAGENSIAACVYDLIDEFFRIDSHVFRVKDPLFMEAGRSGAHGVFVGFDDFPGEGKMPVGADQRNAVVSAGSICQNALEDGQLVALDNAGVRAARGLAV